MDPGAEDMVLADMEVEVCNTLVAMLADLVHKSMVPGEAETDDYYGWRR
jgi:hypothetical protein